MKRVYILLTLLLGLLQFGCSPEVQEPDNSDSDENLFQNPGLTLPNKDFSFFSRNIKFTDFTNAFAGINLENGDIYLVDELHKHQHEIDLLFFDFKNSTKMNVALPSSRQLSVNELGEDVQYGWRKKNIGNIVRLTNVDASLVEWFDRLNSASEINKAVDSVLNSMEAQKLERYRNLSQNEILVFKSFERNISSIILIGNIDRNTESQGHSSVNVMIKSDNKSVKYQSEVSQTLLNANNFYADTLIGYFDRNNANELYFDFQNKKVFNRSELISKNLFGDAHWIFARSFLGNDYYAMDGEYRLMLPNSNNAIAVYDKNLATLFGNSASVQNMEFRKVSVNDIAHIEAYAKYNKMPFDKVRLNNNSLKEYVESFLKPKALGESVASYTSGSPMKNVVWVVRNKTNNSYGLIKFLDLDFDQKVANKSGEFKVAVKYFNSLD